MSKQSEYNFSDFETQIRSGQGAQVRGFILELKNKKLSRYDKLKFANLARRVGLPQVSLNLLRAVVRPPDGSHSFANAEEKSEYAAALIKEGLVAEGIKILQTVNPTECPESLLYLSFGLFTRWDYESAEPHLRLYLKQNISRYQSLVGRTNLIAALIFLSKIDEAQILLKDLLSLTAESEYHLLHSFALELLGQCEVEKKEYKAAKKYFSEAGKGSKNSSTSTPFMVRKWLSIVELLEQNNPNAVCRIQEEASELQDWETLRSCDLQIALATQNSELLQKVYFGTPHYKFREKVKVKSEHFYSINNSFDRIYKNDDVPGDLRIFDIEAASEIGSDIKLKKGQTLHRLLKVISADFYKPVRAAEIFSLVFPNEYFDPEISINRVHQAIKRLRNWIKAGSIPLEIVEKNNTYKLVGTSHYAIRWPKENTDFSKARINLNGFAKHFSGRDFNVREVSQMLNIPERSAFRLVKSAVEAGYLKVIGSGPRTRYCLIDILKPTG